MVRYFSKALDRPIGIFGLKGKWITVFLLSAGGSLTLALIVGCIMTTGMGITVAILGAVVSFVVIYALQAKIKHRDLKKIPLAGKCRFYVRRRATLCRILLEHKDRPSWFAEAPRARDDINIKL